MAAVTTMIVAQATNPTHQLVAPPSRDSPGAGARRPTNRPTTSWSAAAIAMGDSQRRSMPRPASRGEWRMSATKSGITDAKSARTTIATT